MSSTWALVCAGVAEASMPITWRCRPSAAKPTTMPAWVEPVTVQTMMKSNFTRHGLLLRPHLLGKSDIAEAAELVHGGTGRDRVGLAAPAP